MSRYLAVTVLTTELDIMRSHWGTHSTLANSGEIGTDRPIGREIELGGMLLVLDWPRMEVVRTIDLRSPAGMTLHDGNLWVASMRDNLLYRFNDDLSHYEIVTHPLLNDPHSITTGRNGIIVTSTGVDAILEMTADGSVVWSWFAFEHGFDRDRFGESVFRDPGHNHRCVDYPTLNQATHVNSALDLPDRGCVLATLFHQGSILRIDRTTGSATELATGLTQPHFLRRIPTGFTVADTRVGAVRLYDHMFRPCGLVEVPTPWLADALPDPQTGHLIVLDGDQPRILEVAPAASKVLRSMTLDDNWKLFSAEWLK